MKGIDVKSNLKSALEKSTPDCFEKINNGDYVNQINFNVDDVKINKKKAINFNLRYAITISTCLLLMIIGLGAYYVPINDIYIDVNPSIEIKTNLFDRVIVVEAKNDDGTSIINSIDIKNKNIDVAIDDIMNEIISQGFINPEYNDNAILISVNAKLEEQAKRISNSIDESVNNKLVEKNISAVVMKQELNGMKDLQALSKETGVSAGKLQFIQKMIDQNDVEIDADSLYDLKIKELLAYAKMNNISVEELADEIEDVLDDIDEDNKDRHNGDEKIKDKEKFKGDKDRNIRDNEKENIKDIKNKDKRENNKKDRNFDNNKDEKFKNDDDKYDDDDDDDDDKYEDDDNKKVNNEEKKSEKEQEKKEYEREDRDKDE